MDKIREIKYGGYQSPERIEKLEEALMEQKFELGIRYLRAELRHDKVLEARESELEKVTKELETLKASQKASPDFEIMYLDAAGQVEILECQEEMQNQETKKLLQVCLRVKDLIERRGAQLSHSVKMAETDKLDIGSFVSDVKDFCNDLKELSAATDDALIGNP